MEHHDMGGFPYHRESGQIQHDYPNLSGQIWQDISTGETVSGLWVQMGPDKTNGATESNLPIGTEQLVEYRSYRGVTEPSRTFRRIA